LNGSVLRSMFLLQGQISVDGGERLTFWWPVSKKLHDPGHSVVLLQLLLNTKERWMNIYTQFPTCICTLYPSGCWS